MGLDEGGGVGCGGLNGIELQGRPDFKQIKTLKQYDDTYCCILRSKINREILRSKIIQRTDGVVGSASAGSVF
jgi:hypothetical protein